MSKKKPGTEHHRYEVITQQDPDNDDVLLPIPQQLLDQLKWKEGDNIHIGVDKDGKLILSKK